MVFDPKILPVHPHATPSAQKKRLDRKLKVDRRRRQRDRRRSVRNGVIVKLSSKPDRRRGVDRRRRATADAAKRFRQYLP